MGKIGLYSDHFIRKIGLYSEYFVRESGILLYVVILLGAILVLWFVWQNIKIKKVQAEFLHSRAFED
jgi:hypothetical protein